MKIDITTVFKSENCGSFLQAWALARQLSSMGCDAYFRDYKMPPAVKRNKRSAFIKCCLKLRFKRAKCLLKKTSDFKKLRKQFIKTDSGADADLAIFGSDTLWNFKDKFFETDVDFYTGVGGNKPCYTYAISVDSTPLEYFSSHSDTVKNIQKFKRIAVRDSHTEEVVSSFYPREKIFRTADPTLLMDKDVYLENFYKPEISKKKCIVVYYFGAMPEGLWKEVQDFAKKRRLAVVNVGHYEEKYDISLVASPVNLISAFANAEYILTNTFHGCVFSTIFNKQFATNGTHKKKIAGFLDEFALLDRVISENNTLEDVLTRPVDYDSTNRLIEEARKASVSYLKDVICEVCGNE